MLPTHAFGIAVLYTLAGFVLAAGLRSYSPSESAIWACCFPVHALFFFVIAHRRIVSTVGIPAAFLAVLWSKYQQRADFDVSYELPNLLWESFVFFFCWAVSLLLLFYILGFIKFAVDALMEQFKW